LNHKMIRLPSISGGTSACGGIHWEEVNGLIRFSCFRLSHSALVECSLKISISIKITGCFILDIALADDNKPLGNPNH